MEFFILILPKLI